MPCLAALRFHALAHRFQRRRRSNSSSSRDSWFANKQEQYSKSFGRRLDEVSLHSRSSTPGGARARRLEGWGRATARDARARTNTGIKWIPQMQHQRQQRGFMRTGRESHDGIRVSSRSFHHACIHLSNSSAPPPPSQTFVQLAREAIWRAQDHLPTRRHATVFDRLVTRGDLLSFSFSSFPMLMMMTAAARRGLEDDNDCVPEGILAHLPAGSRRQQCRMTSTTFRTCICVPTCVVRWLSVEEDDLQRIQRSTVSPSPRFLEPTQHVVHQTCSAVGTLSMIVNK